MKSNFFQKGHSDYVLDFKFKYMTYIVGGKLNNNPFLMIDCKTQVNQNTYYYNDKVEGFNSVIDETYFCQMGHTDVKKFIQMYDYILHYRKITIDVFNIRDVRNMFDDINQIITNTGYNINGDRGNHIYFISKNNICSYTVNIINNRYCQIQQNNIGNNTCSTSNSPQIRNVNVHFNSLENFCKNIIEEEKCGIIDDLKDRYTFIICNDNTLHYKYPHKNEDDIINMLFDKGFNNLI